MLTRTHRKTAMFNRAGYQRIFIEAVRHCGEAIHIREIRGGGVSRDELTILC